MNPLSPAAIKSKYGDPRDFLRVSDTQVAWNRNGTSTEEPSNPPTKKAVWEYSLSPDGPWKLSVDFSAEVADHLGLDVLAAKRIYSLLGPTFAGGWKLYDLTLYRRKIGETEVFTAGNRDPQRRHPKRPAPELKPPAPDLFPPIAKRSRGKGWESVYKYGFSPETCTLTSAQMVRLVADTLGKDYAWCQGAGKKRLGACFVRGHRFVGFRVCRVKIETGEVQWAGEED